MVVYQIKWVELYKNTNGSQFSLTPISIPDYRSSRFTSSYGLLRRHIARKLCALTIIWLTRRKENNLFRRTHCFHFLHYSPPWFSGILQGFLLRFAGPVTAFAYRLSVKTLFTKGRVNSIPVYITLTP